MVHQHSISFYHKYIITGIMAVLIFGIGSGALASNVCSGTEAVESTSMGIYLVSIVLNILKWARTIPAIVAGELMSNDLTYLQIIGLDTFLFQFRSFVKNLSNIGLVVIIVLIIGKIISGGDKSKIISETINKYGIKLVIAGILINASRWMMGALVDLSTIMVVAVGQQTNKFVTNSIPEEQMNKIARTMPDKITITKCGCLDSKITNPDSENKTWKKIIEKRSEMTGPLIYMGLGIMRFHTYELDLGCQTQQTNSIGDITFKSAIQGFIMIMFVIPLVVLVAYNMFRLLYIRGWIVCSPVIVLIQLFGDEVKRISGDIKKALSLSTVLGGLVQPAFTMAALGVGMMFIMGLYSTLGLHNTTGNATIDGVINTNSEHQIKLGENGEIGSVTLLDNFINDPTGTTGGGFGYFMIALASCLVLWMLVKMSFTISKGGVGQLGNLDFDPARFMDNIKTRIMKQTKLPGGVSINEAAKIVDITDKDHYLTTGFDKRYGEDKATDIKKARTGLEKSGLGRVLGFQNNGDLENTKDAGVTDTKDLKAADAVTHLTSPIKTIQSIANAQSDKKEFRIDSSDRNSYKAMKTWYDNIGKQAIESLELTKEIDGKTEKVQLKDFDTEWNKSSYLGGFVNAILSGKEIKIDNGKVKKIDGLKETYLNQINFKQR